MKKKLFVPVACFLMWGLAVTQCVHDQPADDLPGQIQPLIRIDENLDIDEIDSVYAVVASDSVDSVMVYPLIIDRNSDTVGGKIELPDGVWECDIIVTALDSGKRKIGHGSYSVQQDDFSDGVCVTGTIVIQSARPGIDTIYADESIVHCGGFIHLHASASDVFDGSIAAFEWKCGSGDWLGNGTSGDAVVTAPETGQDYICSLRVSDDDGNTVCGAVSVIVLQHDGPMVLIIAAGKTFQMGQSGVAEPVHEVTFTYNYWIDTTEVTQGVYEQSLSSAFGDYTNPGWNDLYGVGGDYPAYFTDWYDAALYCNTITGAAGSTDTVYSYSSIKKVPGNNCELVDLVVDLSRNGYRLPTEAEWEYACRAGVTDQHYWGNTGSAEDYSWCILNGGAASHPVANKLPNGFDLYDMSGNIWEWCNEKYWSYSSISETDPVGPASGMGRVVRSGSWRHYPSNTGSASRSSLNPGSYYYDVGFRACRPDRPLVP